MRGPNNVRPGPVSQPSQANGGRRDSVRAIVQLYDQIHFTVQRFARITR